MMWRTIMILTITMVVYPAVAQQHANELLRQLQVINPNDLATQASEAVKQYNQMTPDQRAASYVAAQAQVPALIGAATDWWNTLTPEQKSAYIKSVQSLSGAINTK
jgi:hypothetical protein